MFTTAKARTELQAKLLTIAPNAWFKRPPDNKMSYPCIVYRPSTPATEHADNTLYMYLRGYNVIYFTLEPDDSIEQTMLETFEYCRSDREYESDGVYHYSFTLYW